MSTARIGADASTFLPSEDEVNHKLMSRLSYLSLYSYAEELLRLSVRKAPNAWLVITRKLSCAFFIRIFLLSRFGLPLVLVHATNYRKKTSLERVKVSGKSFSYIVVKL